MSSRAAKWLGIDITTTEMALAVVGVEGEGFAAVPMRGATFWREKQACPGFELGHVASMLGQLLNELVSDGWTFEQPGRFSIACRQHDLVVLDDTAEPLLPALSWQCNAAANQATRLMADPQIPAAVGPIEPRFVLPKLAYVLETEPSLRDRVRQVMTTGDWVLGQLTDQYRLSTSDALSNGLLVQETRELAVDALRSAEFEPEWFPRVVQSGHEVGEVSGSGESWAEIRRQLTGWRAVAGLGDNHASALGCGMRNDRTLVVSAGTSGTVNFAVPREANLRRVADPAAKFEFYAEHRLLLRMLAFCGDWYNRFLREQLTTEQVDHAALNEAALAVGIDRLLRIACSATGEQYPDGWEDVATDVRVASVQYSICVELLQHVARLLAEVPDARDRLQQYVLTGGLSQSDFFQRVFAAGIQLLDAGKSVSVSGRTGPLRYKTSAFGAVLNARMPEWQYGLDNIPAELFPLKPCDTSTQQAKLVERLRGDLQSAN